MKFQILLSIALSFAVSSNLWADIKEMGTATPPPPPIISKPQAAVTGNTSSLANTPVPRGKLLYENHCTGCHDSTAHIRADHKAKSIEDIRHWVERWSTDLALKWKSDEINDVVNYLNDEFYKLKAPVRD